MHVVTISKPREPICINTYKYVNVHTILYKYVQIRTNTYKYLNVRNLTNRTTQNFHQHRDVNIKISFRF